MSATDLQKEEQNAKLLDQLADLAQELQIDDSAGRLPAADSYESLQEVSIAAGSTAAAADSDLGQEAAFETPGMCLNSSQCMNWF